MPTLITALMLQIIFLAPNRKNNTARNSSAYKHTSIINKTSSIETIDLRKGV
jgi:hypothetical protein